MNLTEAEIWALIEHYGNELAMIRTLAGKPESAKSAVKEIIDRLVQLVNELP